MAALEGAVLAGLERLTLDWPWCRVRYCGSSELVGLVCNCGPYNMVEATRGAMVVANTWVLASNCAGVPPDRSSTFISNDVVAVDADLVDFAAILDNFRMCPKLALAHSRSCRDGRDRNDRAFTRLRRLWQSALLPFGEQL
jgi:hypothetical protein